MAQCLDPHAFIKRLCWILGLEFIDYEPITQMVTVKHPSGQFTCPEDFLEEVNGLIDCYAYNE